MKKKGIIIGIIIILVVLIMAGIIMVVSRNLGQEAALRVEMQEIYEMLGDTQVFEEEKVKELSSRLEKTVTTGDYAVVEQTIKQYLKECVDYTAGIMDIINSGKIEQLVTANNYESDGPDFVESTKYISETRAKLEEAKTKFTDMLSEEKVKSYIEGKVDNQHYIDLYNKLALGTGEENTLKEDTQSINESLDILINILNNEEKIINMLKENKNHWKIEGDTILFDTDELVQEYNNLINELQ